MNDLYGEGYTRYQAERGRLRRLVRRLYLKRAASFLKGPTVDFGCGVGELLARLPSGSIGLEYNVATVAHCQRKGLDVRLYDGFKDDWGLSEISPEAGFCSMAVSHVLEHLDRPDEILGKLLDAADRVGIQRVLVIVPGPAGYRSDPTHRTFVDADYLAEALSKRATWVARHRGYFPLNCKWLGNFFPYHEYQLVLERTEEV